MPGRDLLVASGPEEMADRILEVSQRLFGGLGWLGLLRALNLTRQISAGLPVSAPHLRAFVLWPPGFPRVPDTPWKLSRVRQAFVLFRPASPIEQMPA